MSYKRYRAFGLGELSLEEIQSIQNWPKRSSEDDDHLIEDEEDDPADHFSSIVFDDDYNIAQVPSHKDEVVVTEDSSVSNIEEETIFKDMVKLHILPEKVAQNLADLLSVKFTKDEEDIFDNKQVCDHMHDMHSRFLDFQLNGNEDDEDKEDEEDEEEDDVGNTEVREASLVLSMFYDGGPLFKRKSEIVWPVVIAILNSNASCVGNEEDNEDQ
jgi:hypothetical protein